MNDEVVKIVTSKTVSLYELAELKSRAYCIGQKSAGDYVDVIRWFWNYNKIGFKVCQIGKQWEIIVMFLLGVISRNIDIFVVADEDADRHGVDLFINGHAIQLKFGWNENSITHWRGSLVCACREDDPGDIFRKILEAGGLSEDVIEDEIENDPGFDAVYEVWDWFI